MYHYVIAELDNGHEIYVDMVNSEAGHYLNRQPYVINLVKEVLATLKPVGTRLSIETDMGRVIGKTDIVNTSEKDVIFYALPYKKDVFARYAKNRFPTPSHTLTILLERDSDGHYAVYDTWIGPCSPPFPGHADATDKSREYWETHALVHDSQIVQTKSITKDCPY